MFEKGMIPSIATVSKNFSESSRNAKVFLKTNDSLQIWLKRQVNSNSKENNKNLTEGYIEGDLSKRRDESYSGIEA